MILLDLMFIYDNMPRCTFSSRLVERLVSHSRLLRTLVRREQNGRFDRSLEREINFGRAVRRIDSPMGFGGGHKLK